MHTFREIGQILPSGLHLLRNGLVLHNRSRNQLREHRYIGTIFDPAGLHLCDPKIYINCIGHRLERKKRNPDRQWNSGKGNRRAKYPIDRSNQKIQIFKKT